MIITPNSLSKQLEALSEFVRILSAWSGILNILKTKDKQDNRLVFFLEVIFVRNPKVHIPPRILPHLANHTSPLRQGPKLRKVDVWPESHIPAPGKGPGLASSIPSDLEISLGAKELGAPHGRLEDSSSRNYWTDTLSWTRHRKSRWREEGLQVIKASHWWEWCEPSKESSGKVIFCVN